MNVTVSRLCNWLVCLFIRPEPESNLKFKLLNGFKSGGSDQLLWWPKNLKIKTPNDNLTYITIHLEGKLLTLFQLLATHVKQKLNKLMVHGLVIIESVE